MIDVVFLLLVFFMLASRFGMGSVLNLPVAQGGAGLSAEQPRLVDVLPGDGYRFNGVACDAQTLIEWLSGQGGDPAATIVLRAAAEADVQRIVDAAQMLRKAGYDSIALAE
ncbi:ExbD/TolR family protein [Aquicoccus sp. G2-2]|uniref:ExbD/TolR family protein n=1 Tax=Aquicoccus sp. G2-2 TaxID=3092120 RepID=UPI002ADFD758|nr:biopolymer transporter ExbD [Aquicoccus sp. G2-2]MEA1114497.1 biopolymer transporter ExbD [Aquicoccus sp. G2-2]